MIHSDSHSPCPDWPTLAQAMAGPALEGPWQVVAGALAAEAEGWRSGPSLTMLQHLMERPGLGDFEVRVRLTLHKAADLEIRLGGYLFAGGMGQRTTRITLDRWVLAVSGVKAAEPAASGQWVCRRSGGRVSLMLDGQRLLDAPDPRPREPVADLTLVLPEGTVLHDMSLHGEPACHQARRPTPASDYDLSVCFDFYDDLLAQPWTTRTYREAASYYRQAGVKRVYFIDHGGYESGFFDATAAGMQDPRVQSHFRRTYDAAGEYLPAMVQAGHAQGLEVFAVFKPYESGIPIVTPTEVPPTGATAGVPHLGGRMHWADHFLLAHPHLRVERDVSSLPADLHERRVGLIRLTAQSGLPADLDPQRVGLWVSSTNGRYHRYQGPCQRRCQGDTLTLAGLDIPEPFVAIEVEGDPGRRFGNVLGQLVQIMDQQQRPLPISLATLRHPRTQPLQQGHYQFDYPLDTVDGQEQFHWLDGGQPLAIGRGWVRYLGGALCEAYPQVHEHWLERVRRSLEAGVDGVDVRILNHNRTFDWQVFGRNRPLVEAFAARHGVDIRREAFEPEHLRRLRGKCYTQWLRQASLLVRGRGKRMQVHVSDRMADPCWRTEMQVHFDWPGWFAQGLADEVTLKMSSALCHRAPQVIQAARQAGLKVHFCPYLNQTHGRPFGPAKVGMAVQEARHAAVDGLILYENAEVMRADEHGAIQVRAPWIVQTLARHARP